MRIYCPSYITLGYFTVFQFKPGLFWVLSILPWLRTLDSTTSTINDNNNSFHHSYKILCSWKWETIKKWFKVRFEHSKWKTEDKKNWKNKISWSFHFLFGGFEQNSGSLLTRFFFHFDSQIRRKNFFDGSIFLFEMTFPVSIWNQQKNIYVDNGASFVHWKEQKSRVAFNKNVAKQAI